MSIRFARHRHRRTRIEQKQHIQSSSHLPSHFRRVLRWPRDVEFKVCLPEIAMIPAPPASNGMLRRTVSQAGVDWSLGKGEMAKDSLLKGKKLLLKFKSNYTVVVQFLVLADSDDDKRGCHSNEKKDTLALHLDWYLVSSECPNVGWIGWPLGIEGGGDVQSQSWSISIDFDWILFFIKPAWNAH